jgi:hypothetical protein
MHRAAVMTATLTALSASFVFAVVLREGRPIASVEGSPAAAEARPSIYPVATTQVPAHEWVRPMQAPNGAQWPQTSGYLAGYWMGRRSGSASITVDARNHPADALVRLYEVAQGREAAVRTVFVVGGERFTLSSLDRGTYELRYRDLDSGAFTRSQRFEVGGKDAGDVTIALHKVRSVKIAPPPLAELRLADAIEPDLIAD